MRTTLSFQIVLALAVASLAALCGCSTPNASPRTLLLIAGEPSHPPGAHEHNAGMLLLQRCLQGVPGLQTRVALNGWPKEPALLEGADAVMIFSDGGVKHPALAQDHLAILGGLMDRGAGLGLIHYAVEPTKEKGQREFISWVGGCFETFWSVNPHWTANFVQLPNHPVARGVKPFSVRDEWYFNMRFADGMKGVTPLLVAVPTVAETMARPNGAHSGNADVRRQVAAGVPQTVAWAFERGNGGRGFATTGAHFHGNWGQDDFRKLVLNAAVWLTKLDVPEGGVASVVTAEDLAANLDAKPPAKVRPPAKSSRVETSK